MSKDTIVREWGTWIVRAILLAGIGYGSWWVKGVNMTLTSLSVDVAYIKGKIGR